MKTYIGLVGEIGSGKGTFAQIIKNIATPISVVHLNFSSVLVETAKLWRLPLTREVLQKIPQAMNEKFGPATLSNTIKAIALEKIVSIIIIDGVRWREDVKMLRTLENNILVYITAAPKIRYERIKTRNEKVGENMTTFEQFTIQALAQTEILIPFIGRENANLKIENNGTLKEFEKKVEEFYDAVIKNGN